MTDILMFDMARQEDRRKAIELRKLGETYSEIRSLLGISKSTLSDWLKNIPLTEDQLRRVKDKIPLRIERYRITRAKQRDERIANIYQEQRKRWLPLSQRELLLAGIFLYWGEGTKVGTGNLTVSNSDPRVIKFAFYWMTRCLGIHPSKIRVNVHLYNDMNIENEIRFWSETIGLPIDNFQRPYIKKSARIGLTYKSFGHGTCNLYTGSTTLKGVVLQSIRAISDYYSEITL